MQRVWSVLLVLCICAISFSEVATAATPTRGEIDCEGSGYNDFSWEDYDGDGLVDKYSVLLDDGLLVVEDIDGNGIEDCYHLTQNGLTVTLYDFNEDGILDAADTDGDGETDSYNFMAQGPQMPRKKFKVYSSNALGFSFKYPQSWQDGEELQTGKIVYLKDRAQVSFKVAAIPPDMDAKTFAAHLAKRIETGNLAFKVGHIEDAHIIGGKKAVLHSYIQENIAGRNEGWYFVITPGKAVWAKVNYVDTSAKVEVMQILASLKAIVIPPTPKQATEIPPPPAPKTPAATSLPNGWQKKVIPEHGLELTWPAGWQYTKANETAHVVWKKDIAVVQVFYQKVKPGTHFRDYSDKTRSEMTGFEFRMDLGTSSIDGHTAHVTSHKHTQSGYKYTMWNLTTPGGTGLTVGMILLDEAADSDARDVVFKIKVK